MYLQHLSTYFPSILVRHIMAAAKALLFIQLVAAAPQAQDNSRPNIEEQQLEPRNVVSTCSIFREPIPTPICYTTLSPLAAPLITVTECHQSVTFSSQFGYAMASSTSAPTVETITTYYVVPWSDLSVGSVPTKSVVAQICSSGHKGCTIRHEKWDTRLSEYTQVTTKTITVATIIVGVSPANFASHARYDD